MPHGAAVPLQLSTAFIVPAADWSLLGAEVVNMKGKENP